MVPLSLASFVYHLVKLTPLYIHTISSSGTYSGESVLVGTFRRIRFTSNPSQVELDLDTADDGEKVG